MAAQKRKVSRVAHVKVKEKPRKSNAGRPSLFTEERVRKLEQGFRNDLTVDECCTYAGISKETYYEWCNKDKDFLTRMESAKRYLFIIAKNNITNALAKNKSVEDSWKFLQKRQKDLYSDKVENATDITTKGESLNKVVYLPELDSEPKLES